jgi:hypothetical protein
MSFPIDWAPFQMYCRSRASDVAHRPMPPPPDGHGLTATAYGHRPTATARRPPPYRHRLTATALRPPPYGHRPTATALPPPPYGHHPRPHCLAPLDPPC